MIPKKLHFIWIGDQSKMPKECIHTWISQNPDYEYKIWDNDSITDRMWKNPKQLHDMLAKKDYAGASDIMRYEILYEEGGVYIDADSYCIKPLEDWLLNCQAFACWENEFIRNNLIANGYIGGVPGADVWRLCIEEVGKKDCTEDKLQWMITGPLLLTDVFFQQRPDLTVYPSHFFIQDHHTGFKTPITGHYFANQLWGSEIGYDNMDEIMKGKI